MIATSYFWSDTLNAFVFGHGPASPTLADDLMLGGIFNRKSEYKVETHNLGGWSGYIQKYR